MTKVIVSQTIKLLATWQICNLCLHSECKQVTLLYLIKESYMALKRCDFDLEQ